MSKFVKFLGKAHINTLNIALYSGGAIRVENVINGKCLAARQFEDVEAASGWFDSFPGDNTSRTIAAIADLTSREND